MNTPITGPLTPEDVQTLARYGADVARQRALTRLAGRIKRAAQARRVEEVARLGAQLRALQAAQETRR